MIFQCVISDIYASSYLWLGPELFFNSPFGSDDLGYRGVMVAFWLHDSCSMVRCLKGMDIVFNFALSLCITVLAR